MEEGVSIPAGEDAEPGTIKSSKFIGSVACSADASIDFLSRAMPLDAAAAPREVDAD